MASVTGYFSEIRINNESVLKNMYFEKDDLIFQNIMLRKKALIPFLGVAVSV